eukprot:GHVU01190886.1.p1 GENE.GHVU01190886.1~~GHVU01190886.1.p1  ORF type:complete len:125 (-),score=6.33 GHVU01190886.1:36-410(-)
MPKINGISGARVNSNPIRIERAGKLAGRNFRFCPIMEMRELDAESRARVEAGADLYGFQTFRRPIRETTRCRLFAVEATAMTAVFASDSLRSPLFLSIACFRSRRWCMLFSLLATMGMDFISFA